MAKGAVEVGRVEMYMNAKIKRHPSVSKACAQYMGSFTVGACARARVYRRDPQV